MQITFRVVFHEVFEQPDGGIGVLKLFSYQKCFHEEGFVIVGAIFVVINDLIVEYSSILIIPVPGSVIRKFKEFFSTNRKLNPFRVTFQIVLYKELFFYFFLAVFFLFLFDQVIDAGLDFHRGTVAFRGLGESAEKHDVAIDSLENGG